MPRPGRSRRRAAALGAAPALAAVALLLLVGAPGLTAGATASDLHVAHVAGSNTPVYQMDCNGQSPLQRLDRPNYCGDIRGFAGVDNQNMWGSRFYDNGLYIGHDEPDATFLSSAPGSGDQVTWGLTLGKDPTALPTDETPGKDVTHWFELTPAPWLSMALCDDFSYPQLPCRPEADANAPAPCSTVAIKCSPNLYPGGGSALMEMQFYPPGNPPFADSASCDDVHWCAALTIDSLECTEQYATCNSSCEEPQEFAFIQTNGVPDPDGTTPDADTMLMNPGDKLSVQIKDAPAGKSRAVEVVIDDLTTDTSGLMQASAANGFVHTSIASCATTPYSYQPEYSSAKAGNYVPWAALRTNISTEFETGHFEPCTSLTTEMPFDSNPLDLSDPDGTMQGCKGPYVSLDKGKGDTNDAMCYLAGDTHPGYEGVGTQTPPDLMTGCQFDIFQNGDLDFAGPPYWPDWPTSATAGTHPGSFVEAAPTSGGKEYASFFFQSDIALSESGCTAAHAARCTIPPNGPGHFYPYWSLTATKAGTCTLEFGNVSTGTGLSDYRKDAEYGSVQWAKLGYPEFIGSTHADTCKT